MNKIKGVVPFGFQKINTNSVISKIPSINTATTLNNKGITTTENYDFDIYNQTSTIEEYNLDNEICDTSISDMLSTISEIVEKRNVSVQYSEPNSLIDGLNKVYEEFIIYDDSKNYNLMNDGNKYYSPDEYKLYLKEKYFNNLSENVKEMMNNNINKQIEIEYLYYKEKFDEYFVNQIGITYNEYTSLINDIKKLDSSSDEYKLAVWRHEKENKLIIDGKINEIPLFYQTDFNYIPYSSANVYSSGCGITSLAMVASYLKNEVISPGELALEYNSRGSNNIERMEKAANELGLSYEYVNDLNKIKSSLAEGKCAIILFTGSSDFSPSSDGHFTVLTDITEDGKILVNDPWENNYSNYALKDGFIDGFSDNQIFRGYVGAWIFDKKQ